MPMKPKICITVDPPLLRQIDAFAAGMNANRSWSAAHLIRTALDHAPVRPHDPRRPTFGDQPRSPDHE